MSFSATFLCAAEDLDLERALLMSRLDPSGKNISAVEYLVAGENDPLEMDASAQPAWRLFHHAMMLIMQNQKKRLESLFDTLSKESWNTLAKEWKEKEFTALSLVQALQEAEECLQLFDSKKKADIVFKYQIDSAGNPQPQYFVFQELKKLFHTAIAKLYMGAWGIDTVTVYPKQTIDDLVGYINRISFETDDFWQLLKEQKTISLPAEREHCAVVMTLAAIARAHTIKDASENSGFLANAYFEIADRFTSPSDREFMNGIKDTLKRYHPTLNLERLTDDPHPTAEKVLQHWKKQRSPDAGTISAVEEVLKKLSWDAPGLAQNWQAVANFQQVLETHHLGSVEDLKRLWQHLAAHKICRPIVEDHLYSLLHESLTHRRLTDSNVYAAAFERAMYRTEMDQKTRKQKKHERHTLFNEKRTPIPQGIYNLLFDFVAAINNIGPRMRDEFGVVYAGDIAFGGAVKEYGQGDELPSQAYCQAAVDQAAAVEAAKLLAAEIKERDYPDATFPYIAIAQNPNGTLSIDFRCNAADGKALSKHLYTTGDGPSADSRIEDIKATFRYIHDGFHISKYMEKPGDKEGPEARGYSIAAVQPMKFPIPGQWQDPHYNMSEPDEQKLLKNWSYAIDYLIDQGVIPRAYKLPCLLALRNDGLD